MYVQLDIFEGDIGRGEPTQPRPGVHTIQELLDSVNVVFCHGGTVDNIADVLRERLALALELLKLDGGDKLECLAEGRGAGAVEKHRLECETRRKIVGWLYLGWAMASSAEG